MSSLRIMVHMAAPCPAWLKEAWIEWLGPDVVCELYGGTEAQSFTWITGREWLEHRGSVGRPLEGGRMKIVGPDGEVLPPGEIGEIYMLPDEGPGSTYHYIGAEPKADAQGWESLGDLGWMDEDGYLYLSDRLKDMILSGGANIYPAEVEGALESHPAVRSCAVIGLPDEDLGQRVHAVVEIAEDVTEEELVAHLSEYLVRYKIPRSFEFTREPVRDDAGKVRRSALRDARAGEAVE
jgi:bile acid-coenzyme A ligase